MHFNQISKKNNQKGFSLVELLVVLGIMGIVMAAAYNFFFYSHKSYALADARSTALQEIDLFFLHLEKDVRSAAAPNTKTKSVHISDNGKRIDIYSTSEEEYILTSYRIKDNTIQNGWASSDKKIDTENPQYGGIPDTGDGSWKTSVNNVMVGDMELFRDRNNDDNIAARRLVDVDLYVLPPGLNNSINMKTSLLTRTGKSTASILEESEASSYKKVDHIKFFDSVTGNEITTIKLTKNDHKIIIAKAFASDGSDPTNKNLLFKQNLFSISWLSFPGYAVLYDDGTGSILEEIDLTLDGYRDRMIVRSGQQVKITSSGSWLKWDGKIQVESTDGPSATLTITQK